MIKAKVKAAIVLVFMMFLAAQAATGFMRSFFGGQVYPRAMRAMDWVLETVFTGPLGQIGGAIALSSIGLLFAILVWQGDARSERSTALHDYERRTAQDQRASADVVMRASEFSDRRPEHVGPPIWEDTQKRAWICCAFRPDGMAYKRGARAKFYNHDWEPATYDIPDLPDEVYEGFRRHWDGYALQRPELTEALAVFDANRFAKERDLFMAGPFAAVKGQLASVLSRFDFGEGGLVPLAVYEADLVTPYPGDFFLLNFGARKDSLLPEQSSNVAKWFVNKSNEFQYWKINSWHEHREVALSSVALEGPDFWFEEKLTNELFVSDAVAEAVIEAGMAKAFKLKECRVLRSS